MFIANTISIFHFFINKVGKVVFTIWCVDSYLHFYCCVLIILILKLYFKITFYVQYFISIIIFIILYLLSFSFVLQFVSKPCLNHF